MNETQTGDVLAGGDMSDLYKAELLGKTEASRYNRFWWFFWGVFTGFFAIPFVYWVRVKPKGRHSSYQELDNEMTKHAYLNGYQAEVKRRRLWASLLGSVCALVVIPGMVLLVLLIAGMVAG